MKVLYLAHSGGLQGAGIALLNIMKGINKNIVTPVVVIPKKGDMFIELNKLGVKCYIVPFNIDIYPLLNNYIDYCLFIPRLVRYLITKWIAKNKVRTIIKNENIDIIHTNTGVIHWGAKIAKQMRLPHVWHIREMQDLDFGYKPIRSMSSFRKQCKDKNNHCIAITKSVFQHHLLDQDKDVVIYDGVFSSKILNNKIVLEKENYLLFVGTLTKAKGIYDAILAFEKIASINSQIELWIVGHINLTVTEFIDNCKYNGRIKLLGFRRDVYKLMSKAKALLVPSHFEGFGFITAEAMVNGCLVIGRNTAGTKEQFDNGLLFTNTEIGLRFDSQVELEEKIRYVCNSSTHDILPILSSAKLAVSNYTIENNVKRLQELYLNIMKHE